jgi:hypothetical protein
MKFYLFQLEAVHDNVFEIYFRYSEMMTAAYL